MFNRLLRQDGFETKSEIRSTKSETNRRSNKSNRRKFKTPNPNRVCLEFWDFGHLKFVSNFGFRASNFQCVYTLRPPRLRGESFLIFDLRLVAHVRCYFLDERVF